MTESKTSVEAQKKIRMWAETAAKLPVDGIYETPGKAIKFRVKESYGDIHIYYGKRLDSSDPYQEGNLVFFDKMNLIRETIVFIGSSEAVALGSTTENRLPEPDSLEAFLRSHSVGGKLASYVPPILAGLGVITIEKHGRALYCRLSDVFLRQAGL
ncbi:MAG: hypothetical protein NUW37_01270 [Planctomycetes bacterium]|nr:hypothetical protein [Planctomycetota bacterium]